MLTDRYLKGVPAGSRAASDKSLSPDLMTDEAMRHIRALNRLAARPRADAWPSWRSPGCCETNGSPACWSVRPRSSSSSRTWAPPRRRRSPPPSCGSIDRHAVEAGIDLWKPSRDS
jgi:L-glyceraldehyde 3-phosphate reductase